MSTLQQQLAASIADKLTSVRGELSLHPIRIFDVGIFPWHTSIELSFLCEGDAADEDDIAAWPHYNFSAINEGKWQSAKPICEQIEAQWNETLDVVPVLKMVANCLRFENVQDAISQLPRASDFQIQVLNSDDADSPNYFA